VITKEKLLKLANSAALELSEEETDILLKKVNAEIESVVCVTQADVEDVERLQNPYDMTLSLDDDEINDGNMVDDVMKNAPNPLYNFFTVPKILKGGDE